MNSQQFADLILQSLEHERGGVKIYQTAIECALRDDLRGEWQKYLAQTEQHVQALTKICETFGLDPFTTTPGTQIVKIVGTPCSSDGAGARHRQSAPGADRCR